MELSQLYNRKEFLKDIGVISLILLTPLLFYVYLLFPESSKLETPFFTINTKYYEDIQVFIWTFSIKISFILMFSVWYLTCKHWWRICLLIPIIFFLNQLIVVINDELQNADHYEFGISFAISIPIIVVLLVLSKKLKYYSESKSLAEELDLEINQLFKNVVIIKHKDILGLKREMKYLKSQKSKMTSEEYLKKLIRLRDMID